TVRRRQGEWLLQSSTFDHLQFDEGLHRVAYELLHKLEIILAVYLGFEPSLRISGLLRLGDGDTELGRLTLSRPVDIAIRIVPPGVDPFRLITERGLANLLLSSEQSDPEIKEMFSLLGNTELSWGRIYDIIEFLGNEKGINAA